MKLTEKDYDNIATKLLNLYNDRWLNPLCGIIAGFKKALRLVTQEMEKKLVEFHVASSIKNKYELKDACLLINEQSNIEVSFGLVGDKCINVWYYSNHGNLRNISVSLSNGQFSVNTPTLGDVISGIIGIQSCSFDDFVRKCGELEADKIIVVKTILEGGCEEFLKELAKLPNQYAEFLYLQVGVADKVEDSGAKKLRDAFDLEARSPMRKRTVFEFSFAKKEIYA